MQQIKQQLTELQNLTQLGDQENNEVSKVGSYWHIDHALQVINSIPQALASSQPNDFKPKWSFLKWTIMTFKKIPRGKGRAPKHVLPKETISKNHLLEQLRIASKRIESLKQLDSKSHFKHPLFGHLNLKESQKFLYIHTEHHLKIIRDIIR
ncbi:hypothetical protein BST92_10010 [Nonlabens arenilitoris]|uniref:DUF1569 domain-containing protein n=1 Tax=Nonlabens arenilitoris TaxID=1217969 RepID=A0A2S7UBJ2_9FLAO|nr:DUF1569 domain-containing protein [Nonlabens arenilitoris]PQJ32239.1 hypothetical protein BST92_10010 [Nonlabens arenilitoris]